MQLSLVICTRNRAPQLAESLETLTRLQCQVPWELIIVDNGSKDQTQDVIKNYGERLRPKTIIESQAGLGRARNRGWALSQGEIVVFTDDDCYPADDFLYSVVRCLEEDPLLGAALGRWHGQRTPPQVKGQIQLPGPGVFPGWQNAGNRPLW